MSTFDPMAAAIDWLDAYRAGSPSIIDFYAPGAVLECGCGGAKVARGRVAIFDYWLKRFVDYPAGELVDLPAKWQCNRCLVSSSRGAGSGRLKFRPGWENCAKYLRPNLEPYLSSKKNVHGNQHGDGQQDPGRQGEDIKCRLCGHD